MTAPGSALTMDRETAAPARQSVRLQLEHPGPGRKPTRKGRSRQGDAAIGAVTWGILERVGRCGTLRIETIPATWPMTRHLVRRLTSQLVAAGLLERTPTGAVQLTREGRVAREAERLRRGE